MSQKKKMANDSAEALLRDLKLAMSNVFSLRVVAAGEAVGECSAANRLLFALENALSHGLRPPNAGFAVLSLVLGSAQPHIFDWFEHLPDCLPGSGALVDRIRAASPHKLARSRLFIRSALNEGSLAESVRALSWSEELTAAHFAPGAIVRTPELQMQLVTRLEALTVIRFSLDTSPDLTSALASPNYWKTADLTSREPEPITRVRKPSKPKLKPVPATATVPAGQSIQTTETAPAPAATVSAAPDAAKLEAEARALEEQLLKLGAAPIPS